MHMEVFGLGIWDVVLRLGLGVVVGFCIGLTGVGGGVLGLQAMTLVLRMDPIAAVGTTGLYIFLTKISASVHHARLKNISWGVSARILSGALPANILVARWVSRQGNCPGFVEALKVFIICVVLFSVSVMALDTIARLKKKVERKERNLAAKIEGHWFLRNVFCFFVGALLGGVVGATSLGGGCLIVPILIVIFGLTTQRAVGTSILIALFLTFATALIYGKGGEVEFPTAVVMAVGSLAGVKYGSTLSVKLPEQRLRLVVIGLILVAAAVMIVNR